MFREGKTLFPIRQLNSCNNELIKWYKYNRNTVIKNALKEYFMAYD